jgi:hypothetical protein
MIADDCADDCAPGENFLYVFKAPLTRRTVTLSHRAGYRHSSFRIPSCAPVQRR